MAEGRVTPKPGRSSPDRRGGAAGGPDAEARNRTGRLTADELGFPDRVTCPFCEKDDTELHSPFGSALSVATYWCNRCRTAFEWIKRDQR